ncbi:hypothetical protein [Flavobacterium terrisoli]|uniref:hypothetical protein n=1 Tax=Flavobacterium terrisoli TaxID=3242195 RepID=UPI002542C6A2|nr:hypothetical protein [Flavobacterium buctense]
MKRLISKIISLTCLALLFTFSGCAELTDCIISAKPQLPTKTLHIGQVGIPYSEYIKASVRHDSNDDYYDYDFNIDGSVPPGIIYQFHDRRILFSGTPTIPGSYTFRVHLTISYDDGAYEGSGLFDDSNTICFGNDNTQKTYTIIVQ